MLLNSWIMHGNFSPTGSLLPRNWIRTASINPISAFAYTNNETKEIYTNTGATYTSDLTGISGFSNKKPYVQLNVNDTAANENDAQSGLTNLNLSNNAGHSVAEWISLLRTSTYDENCSFLAWIDDTSLPVHDSMRDAQQNFQHYRIIFIPAAVICVFSFLLLLIDFIWLTVHTCRKCSADGNTEKHMNAFDRIYTEIAAGLVFIPALGVVTVGLNLQYSTYNTIVSVIITEITVFLVSCLFWLGYLSLIRRLKAHTLWEKQSFPKMPETSWLRFS